jgi:hypothetical protein
MQDGPRRRSILPHFGGVHSLTATGAAFAVSIVVAGCGGSSREHIAITVGGSAITASAVDHWISVMAPPRAMPEPPRFAACIAHLKELAQYPTSQAQFKEACRDQYRELRQSALSFLIANQWLIGEAADQGTRVSDQEVSRRLRGKYASPDRKMELNELRGIWGHTTSDLELEVQAELAAMRIRRRLLSYSREVSRSQIASYYRHNIHRFRLPERRYVEMLGNLRSKTMGKVVRRIRQGTSFASMSFDEQLERPKFSDLVMEKRIFYRAIFRARPNVIVGPLEINGYYFLFRVTSITPSRVQSLAEAGKTIKKELSVRRRVRFVESWRRKWIGETSCAPAYVVQKCKQYHGPLAPEDPLDVN